MIRRTVASATLAVSFALLFLVSQVSADSVPPLFYGGYPRTENVRNTFLDIEVQLNEPGTAYFIIVPQGSTSPTSAQVKARNNYANVHVKASGHISVGDAGTTYTHTATGLKGGTVYDIYVVAKDEHHNLQTLPTRVDERTADETAPDFISGYPMFEQIAGTEFDVLVQINEIGRVYYVMLPRGSDEPTSEEVMQGLGHGREALACGVIEVTSVHNHHTDHQHYAKQHVANMDPNCLYANGFLGDDFYGVNFYGLNATEEDGLLGKKVTCNICPTVMNGTHYDVWFVTEDDESTVTYFRANNYADEPVKVELYTGDFRIPVYTPGYPMIQNLEPFDLDVAMASDEKGHAYFVMVYANASAPTSKQVMAGTDYTAKSSDIVGLVGGGNFSLPHVDKQYDFHVSGFQDETYYHVYTVIEDTGNVNTPTNVYISTSPNYQVKPNELVFYAPDGTPPVFVGDVTPTTANVYGTSFDVVVQMDEVGEVTYVVVLNGSPSPSVEDLRVFAGKDGEGALACGTIDVFTGYLNMTGSIVGVLNPDQHQGCLGADAMGADAEFYGLDGLGGSTVFCQRCPIIDSETTYDIYLLARDDDMNWQLTWTLINVTTPDITPPKFINHHPAVTANNFAVYDYLPNDGGVTLNLTTSIDERGRAFYIVVLDGSDDPTSKEVKAGESYRGNYVWAAGYIDLLDVQKGITVQIIGLSSETQFDIWVVAEDDEDLMPPYPGQPIRPANLQLKPTRVPVYSADITPPYFLEGYPNIPYADLSGEYMDVETMINEPGTVFWVIVPQNFTFHHQYTDGTARLLPTPEEVKAGVGPGGEGQVVFGSIDSPDPNVTETRTIKGLTPQTKYDIYFVAEDDEHSGDNPPNLQPYVTKINFQTRDIEPPKWQKNYPALVIGGESLDVVVRMDELGKFYYIVVPHGSDKPSPHQVFKGHDYGDVEIHAHCNKVVDEIEWDKICTVNSLISETWYDVHIVAEDNTDDSIILGQSLKPNQQTKITSFTFRTRDITAPEFLEGTPFVTDLLGTQVDININMVEQGMAFFTIMPDDSEVPTAQQVKVGIGANSTLPQSFGNISIPTHHEFWVGTAAGLISERDYTVYITAQDDGAMDLGPDDSPNLRWQTDEIFIRTPDITPPAWEGRWSKNGTIANVGGTFFDVVVQLNEVGTVYYVVVPFEAAKPDSEDNKALKADRVVACGVIDVDEAFLNRTGPVVSINVQQNPECADEEAHGGFYGLDYLSDLQQPRFKGLEEQPSFYGLGGYEGLGSGEGMLPYCARCPKIHSETPYDVYIVAEDDGGHGVPAEVALDERNLQIKPQKVNRINYDWALPSVVTADITPPEFVLSTPYGIKFQGAGFDLVVALDEPGKVFYCVVPIEDTGKDPSREQIKKGVDGYDQWCPAYGEIEVPKATSEVITTVLGLGNITREEDRYFVYVYAEDDEPTGMSMYESPNEGPVQDPLMIETVDVMAPLFKPGYPKANNAIATTGFGELVTTFDVIAALDEPGTTYYVAFLPTEVGTVHPGAYAPSSEQVRDCQDYMGMPAAVCGSFSNPPDGATTTHVLTDRTVYDIYVVSEDDTEVFSGGLRQRGPNIQSKPTKITITTADGRAPLFSGNPCNTVNDTICTSDIASYIGAHSPFPYTYNSGIGHTTLVAAITEPGRVYYLVVDADDPDPTKEQVYEGDDYKEHSGHKDVEVIRSGHFTLDKANKTYEHSITGLPETPYFIYVVTYNNAGNIGDGDVLRTVLINPTKLVPNMVKQSGENITVLTTETTATPYLVLSAPAKVYYVVLREGAPMPNATQIVHHKDAWNNTAPGGDFADTSLKDASGHGHISKGFHSHSVGTITNLTRGVYYDLWVVLKHTDSYDDNGPDNKDYDLPYEEFSRVPVLKRFRTPDYTAPYFQPGYPNITVTKGYNFTFAVYMDEPGKAYWTVQVGGSQSPSSHQVTSCVAGDGEKPLKCGKIKMPTIEANRFYPYYEVTVEGFHPETMYDLYVVAKDDEDDPNLQALPTRLPVITSSVDARLSNLTVSEGVLQPAFNPYFSPFKAYPYPDNWEYNVFLDDGVSSLDITPTAMSAESIKRIKINGTAIKSLHSFTFDNIPYGATRLPIEVFAGDDTTTLHYNLTVTRVADSLTHNATLERLYVVMDNGITLNATDLGGKKWPYCTLGCTIDSPDMCRQDANPNCVMDTNQTQYTLYVPVGVTSVDVYPYTTSPRASTKLYTLGTHGVQYPGGLPGYTTGVAPATDRTVNLYVLAENGGNTIDIVVTAGDGTQLTYTITVVQHGPGVYGEDWQPVVPTTADHPIGGRYGSNYGRNDDLTTFVALNPTLPHLNVIPELDVLPPEWLETFPRLANASVDSVDLVLQTDEPSRVYYLFAESGARAPTSREVMQPFLREDAVAAGLVTSEYQLTQEISHKVFGLAAETAYDVYLVAEDAALDFKVQYAFQSSLSELPGPVQRFTRPSTETTLESRNYQDPPTKLELTTPLSAPNDTDSVQFQQYSRRR